MQSSQSIYLGKERKRWGWSRTILQSIRIKKVNKALNNIHNQITDELTKSIHLENSTFKKFFTYKFFENLPLNSLIYIGEFFDDLKQIEESTLHYIFIWKQNQLMKNRNAYLKNAKNYLINLNQILDGKNPNNGIHDIIKAYSKNYDEYKISYKKWIATLKKAFEQLNNNLIQDPKLDHFKKILDLSLKMSENEYEILEKGSFQYYEAEDRTFINPILNYHVLINIYFKCFDIIKSAIINATDITAPDETIEALPFKDILQSVLETYTELQLPFEEQKQTNKLNSTLLLKLKRAQQLFDENFKVEETLTEKEDREYLLANIHFSGTQITLKQACKILQIKPLKDLDTSLQEVEKGTKSIEAHNKYFDEKLKEIRNLSLKYHPDKQQEQKDPIEQRLIYDVINALKKIQHNYIARNLDMCEQPIVYRLFKKEPLQKMVETEFLRPDMLKEQHLRDIVFWRGELLMKGRNTFLSHAKYYLEKCHSLLDSCSIWSRDQRNELASIKEQWEKSEQPYQTVYREEWINRLEQQKKSTQKKECKAIRKYADHLLEDAHKQYQILLSEGRGQKGDQTFVQPILDYRALGELYFKFFDFAEKNQISHPYPLITEETKQTIQTFSYGDLLTSAQETLHKILSGKTEEMSLLFFQLERGQQLLQETFKRKQTILEKSEKRSQEEFKKREEDDLRNRRKMEELIQASEETREELALCRAAREEAERQAASKRAIIEQCYQGMKKMLLPICCEKLQELDQPLQAAIDEESKEVIVQAAIDYENGVLGEEVIEAIIEEIKSDRMTIIEAKKITPALIKRALGKVLHPQDCENVL